MSEAVSDPSTTSQRAAWQAARELAATLPSELLPAAPVPAEYQAEWERLFGQHNDRGPDLAALRRAAQERRLALLAAADERRHQRQRVVCLLERAVAVVSPPGAGWLPAVVTVPPVVLDMSDDPGLPRGPSRRLVARDTPLGRALRLLRLGLGQSLEEFSQDLGVSWMTVQRWETGKITPPAQVRAHLRLVLYRPEVVKLLQERPDLVEALTRAELLPPSRPQPPPAA